MIYYISHILSSTLVAKHPPQRPILVPWFHDSATHSPRSRSSLLQISNRLQPLHLFGCQKEDAKGFFSSIWKVFLHCELVSVSTQHEAKFRNDASSQRLTFQNKSQKKTFASSEKTQKRVFCCSRFEICSNNSHLFTGSRLKITLLL